MIGEVLLWLSYTIKWMMYGGTIQQALEATRQHGRFAFHYKIAKIIHSLISHT